MSSVPAARAVLRWWAAPLRFSVLALVLVLIAIFTLVLRLDSVQGDTWWALRAGKDMWHDHRVIRRDTYSYTAYGRPWPDHAWLYQVILYAVYVIGRLPLVSVVNALVATLALAVARPRGRATWADVVAIAPVIAIVSISWSVRPQVMSLLLLAVIVRLVHAERLRAIVLLMLVWANLHGAVALGGLVLAGAVLASTVSWVLSLRGSDAEVRRSRGRRLARFGVTAAASLAATLLNPLGWGLWRYIATASSRPGEEWIAEWQPSWTAPWITAWFWIWCAVLVAVLGVRWRRMLQWPVLLGICTSLMIAPLAWTSIRNIGSFGIVTLPLLIHLLRRQGPERPVGAGSLLPGGRILIALATVAAAVAGARTLQSHDGLGWDPMSPAAARAIARCPGNVFTTYNSGAYLIWFTPEKRVFVDNRQDPYDARVLEYRVGAGKDWPSMLAQYDVRCAALNLSVDPQEIVTLGALSHWPAAYADHQWMVLVNPSPSPEQPLMSQIAPDRRGQ